MRLVHGRNCAYLSGMEGTPTPNGNHEPDTGAPTTRSVTSLRHDQARSRAYRWGEDGLGGISDDKQRSASRSRSGTNATRSSRSACSG